MAETKRCPKCGASNPESAEWCSLCLERFEEPAPEPAAVAVAEAGRPAGPGGTAAPGRAPTESSAFRVTDEGIKWICQTCETPNSIESSVCEVCGTTFAEMVRPKEERPQRDPATVALYSLFLPGAGHAYMGMWGQAVARFVLSFWVLLVTLVGILDDNVPGSLAMATLFGVVALGLWLLAAHDAFREASGQPELVILRGRRFLYLVLGLMALMFVAMLIALLTARGESDAAALSIPAWRSTLSRISTEHPTG